MTLIPPPLLFVVDDEPGVCLLLKRLAEPVGFEVVVGSSAAEALAKLPGRPADMAFVDLRMPDTKRDRLDRGVDRREAAHQHHFACGHRVAD